MYIDAVSNRSDPDRLELILSSSPRRVALAATARNQLASRASGARFVSTLKEYKVRTTQVLDTTTGTGFNFYDDIMEYGTNGTTTL